jgi:hypothetical protein
MNNISKQQMEMEIEEMEKKIEYNNLDKRYKNCSLHIALERADNDNDWKAFKTIYFLDMDNLYRHILMTSNVFTWNYTKLPQEQKSFLFTSSKQQIQEIEKIN